MSMRKLCVDTLEEFFSVEDGELGRGGHSIVLKVRRKEDGKIFACKSMRITDYTEQELMDDQLPKNGKLENAEAEIRALVHLSSVMKGGVPELIDVFREKDYYYVVIELCHCSLWHGLRRKERLSEEEAAAAIKRLAQVVDKMHKNGVVHRDIKPSNILLGRENDYANLKLADFGTAWMFGGDEEVMHARVGTDRYIAPEVVQPLLIKKGSESYDERVDVWGVGTVLYEILSGKSLFQGIDTADVIKRLVQLEDLPLTALDWTNVSDEAKNLIVQILHPDPEFRLSLSQIWNHPWVVKHTKTEYDTENSTAPGEKTKKRSKRDAAEAVSLERSKIRHIGSSSLPVH